MYDLDDNPGRPYTGLQDDGIGDRCPICGTPRGSECPDAVAVPMPHPPVDIYPSENPTGGNDG